MSEEQKHGHSVLGWLYRIADELEPLDEVKNPGVAAALAFALGGIGLGLYLKSLKDALIPFGLFAAILILGIPTGEALLVAAPFVWAAYGYYRVKSSNERVGAYSSAGRIIDAEIITTPPHSSQSEQLAKPAKLDGAVNKKTKTK